MGGFETTVNRGSAKEDAARLLDTNSADLLNVTTKERLARLQMEQTKAKDDHKDRITDRDKRLEYADKVYYMVVTSMTLVFFMLMLQGFSFIHLSDDVLRYVVAAIVIEALGVFGIVIGYFFKKG